jgi:putative DNA methylase
MRVKTALALINQVLGEVLDEQAGDFDPETRWAITWFTQHGFDEARYGVAEQLAVAMDVSVAGMQGSGILRQGGGKVRLLPPEELPAGWDPRHDLRTPVWEATHHLIRRLEDGSADAAGELLALLGGLGEAAQHLAYRLYLECERSRPALANRYNALVADWSRIHAAATSAPGEAPAAQQQLDV